MLDAVCDMPGTRKPHCITLTMSSSLSVPGHAQMTDNSGLRAMISKAQVIDELENTLPSWVKRQKSLYPNYIHVLKVGYHNITGVTGPKEIRH